MSYHPPAAGGKTAWGVNKDRVSDDPMEMEKARLAKMDFQDREAARLNRLKEMDADAGSIMDSRTSRRNGFEMSANIRSGDDWKIKNDEILKKMQDAKELKQLERKRLREETGEGKKKRRKKKKVKQEASSSSSSEDDDSSSTGSSSSSEAKVKEEAKKEEIAEEAPLDPEAQRQRAEARAREREVKRKAAEQAVAWAAEVKRKQEEMELQRRAEAKRKEEEAINKAKQDAINKVLEKEAKREEDEAKAKQKAAEIEARKGTFASASSSSLCDKKGTSRTGELMIGGFRKGQTVFASKNITVKQQIVIKMNCRGTIIGPSENNPMQRIAVKFDKREDRIVGMMNCVPADIKKTR